MKRRPRKPPQLDLFTPLRSILVHREWPALRRHLRIESYDRDQSAAGDIRHRIEVLTPDEEHDRAWLLALSSPCVACGKRMHPIRERGTWGTLYFAAACPLSVRPSCSRGRAAAGEYRAVVRALTSSREEAVAHG